MKLINKMGFAAIALIGSISSQVAVAENNVSFPNLSDTYLKTGDFVNVSNLLNIGLGQTYSQVRILLGNPHFSEGLGSPREYNYAFNFYTNQATGQYITCQYQVQFDDKHKVKATYWKDKQCEDYIKNLSAKPAAAPVVVRQPVHLSSDGLFAFGKSGFNDLQESGRQRLQELAGQIKTGYSNVHSINITGYTDRIGRPEANMRLSLARANTVKQYLVEQGIPASLIQTSGQGAANPVVTCNGVKSAATIQCLMPNRRIEVTVEGEK